jgi:hypothetical protein
VGVGVDVGVCVACECGRLGFFVHSEWEEVGAVLSYLPLCPLVTLWDKTSLRHASHAAVTD